MEEDDDIPSLDDLTEQLQKKFNFGKTTHNNKRSEYLEPLRQDKNEKRLHQMLDLNKPVQGEKKPTKEQSTTTKSKSQNASNYCGFKKGFLSGGLGPEKPVKKSENVIEVNVDKETAKKKNVFPEVQSAMQKNVPDVLKSKDWVSEELLEKVLSHPVLSKKFLEPRYNHVVQQLITNPQQALQCAQGDPEMREFIQAMCALMGDHFTKLAEKENTVKMQPEMSKEDEKKMQSILSDPEVANILQNPIIQTLMHCLRTDPDKAQKILRTADHQTRRMIQKLIVVGLIQKG